MPTLSRSGSWREESARELLSRLQLRAALSEGVGIFQAWHQCAQQEARDQLLAEHGRTGRDAEAHRMIATVDATARGRADPEAHWG